MGSVDVQATTVMLSQMAAYYCPQMMALQQCTMPQMLAGYWMNMAAFNDANKMQEVLQDDLYAESVSFVRDFEAWLRPLGVTLYNTMMPRAGRPAAHAFSVKIRADLSPREVQDLGRPRRQCFPDSPEDVFIVCKTAHVHV